MQTGTAMKSAIMIQKFLLTTVTLHFGFLVTSVVGKTYYILPTDTTSCLTRATNTHNTSLLTTPDTPDQVPMCFTLTQYAQLWSESDSVSVAPNDSNITLIFTPGNHILGSNLWIQNVTHLILQVKQTNSSSLSATTVTCTNSAGFIFENIPEITVGGLVFNDCQENSVRSIDQLRVEDCTFQNGHGMQLRNVTNATFERSSFISLRASIGLYFESLEEASGGAIFMDRGSIKIRGSLFYDNRAEEYGGAIYSESGSVSIHESYFSRNTAWAAGGAIYVGGNMSTHEFEGSIFSENVALTQYGGAIYLRYGSILSINSCNFTNNHVLTSYSGGALYATTGCILSIHGCHFSSNRAGDGGAMSADSSSIDISDCRFSDNTANIGGAISVVNCSIFIDNSNFSSNTAYNFAGAIYSENRSLLYIHGAHFSNNTAHQNGGALYYTKLFGVSDSMQVHVSAINNSIFDGNCAANKGGAIYVESGILNFTGFTQMTNNSAMIGVVFAFKSTLISSGNTTISDNNASFYAFASNVTFGGNTKFMNNFPLQVPGLEKGGAITSFQSEIALAETVKIMYNEVENGYGGGILLSGSRIYAYGNTTIAHNTALSGGGIYAYQSEMNFFGITNVTDNFATLKGGGIYAVGSVVKLNEGQLHFIENRAEKGGGTCLELNAKLYVIKAEAECTTSIMFYLPDIITGCRILKPKSMQSLRLHFTNNLAEYGGALYISDETISGICDNNANQPISGTSECFFQNLALYTLRIIISDHSLIVQNIFFTGNSANKSGKTIFGGLLDRCTVSPYAQVFYKYGTMTTIDAISYLTNSSDLRANALKSEISSEPVHVCFCTNNQPDCNDQPPMYAVRKGETFKVRLVAVDQVRNPVPSSVWAFLSSNLGGLGEGQDIQNTTADCTELNYTITSPQDSEQLVLYADGPCNDLGISRNHINVTFLPCDCPVGFVKSGQKSNCSCECDPCLFPNYISDCSFARSAVKRKNNIWLSYINETTKSDVESMKNIQYGAVECPFLIYLHCPFDYCNTSSSVDSVWVNLNTPTGHDAHCAFNRSGKLCGACKEGLSLTLGSSHCQLCSNYWLTLLFVFAIAGVVLVAFLLFCNLTVAVGTINGLIFYANIIATNRATFFPFETPNFFTIFIAWLNLDFGFVTCFFDGMDDYAKEWLQLAFPLYIIIMVATVIIASEYSTRVVKLFTGTNPVATLATLILLSYAKSLRVIIAAMSHATLDYPDGSKERVWLIDANIQYLKGKHIPLFLIALLILLVGIIYTAILLTYQWLLHCPNRKPLKWIKNARFYPFLDAYHAPYTLKHRYWTGLLLLIHAFLYVIAAFNVAGEPGDNLLSIICTLFCLILLKVLLPSLCLHIPFSSKSSLRRDVTRRPLEKRRNRKADRYDRKVANDSLFYKSWPLEALEISFIFNLIMFSVGSLYVQREAAYGTKQQEALAYASTSIAFITFVGILIYHTYFFVLPRKTRSKLNSLKLNQLFKRNKMAVPEIILIPNAVCTYSEVALEGTSQNELDKENTTAADSELERNTHTATEDDVATANEPLNHSENSLVIKKITKSGNNQTKIKVDGKQQRSVNVDIELELRPSKFSDDTCIRDSEEWGMMRETEVTDLPEASDSDSH